VFPLDSTTSFEEADANDLRSQATLPGMTGEKLDLTIVPEEVRDVRGPVDERTRFVGVLADFYDGPRRLLLEPSCLGDRPRRVLLGSSDAAGDGRPTRWDPAPTGRRSSSRD